MRHALIAFALLATACGDLPIDGLKEDKDEKKEDGKDTGKEVPGPTPDCFALDASLTCSKVPPEEMPTADGCKWIVAESFPEKVSGRCTPAKLEGDKAVFELPVRPNAATLNVKKGDTALDAANVKVVDGDGEKAKLEVKGAVAGEELQISYTGAGNVTEQPKGSLGVVEDATGLDGCKWLIKLDNGTRLEPINLDPSYQKAGTRVRVEYTPPETDIASICMAGQLVKITSIAAEKDSGAGLKSCDDARAAFKKVVDEIDALPKTCATNADCVAFGLDTTSGCPRSLFTAKTSFDPRAADHTAASQGVTKQCPAPEVQCAAFFATKPVCDMGTKLCKGGF